MAGFDGSLRERQCRRSYSAIPARPANGGYAYVESVGHCRIFSAIPSASRRCAFAKIRSPDERSDIRENCPQESRGRFALPGYKETITGEEVDGTAQGQDGNGGGRGLDRSRLG